MKTAQSIVLVGFMGTGKTTVGKALAKRLGLTFLDMDDVIVERAGKSIPEIFAEDGEGCFRALERQVVHDLAASSGHVIATGGGVVTNPDNVAALTSNCCVICLQSSPESILERVKHDTNRPLLQTADKLGKIRELLASRQALYDAIPHHVQRDGLEAEAVVDQLLEIYQAAG